MYGENHVSQRDAVKRSVPEAVCPLCGGSKAPGTTTYRVDLGLVVVRNVRAAVCTQCGEEWVGSETAAQLERITEEARERGNQVEVVAL